MAKENTTNVYVFKREDVNGQVCFILKNSSGMDAQLIIVHNPHNSEEENKQFMTERIAGTLVSMFCGLSRKLGIGELIRNVKFVYSTEWSTQGDCLFEKNNTKQFLQVTDQYLFIPIQEKDVRLFFDAQKSIPKQKVV